MIGRVLGIVGRVLVGTGVLVLLFVVHQLWGTSLVETRAQNALEDDFAAVVAAPEPAPSRSNRTRRRLPRQPPTPRPGPNRCCPRRGALSPGWRSPPSGGQDRGGRRGPGTSAARARPLCGIAAARPGRQHGHRRPRTTYGAPFYRLDELEPGDVIRITTRDGEFVYEVTDSEVVAPTRVDVLDDFGDDRLTLTACNPRYPALLWGLATAASAVAIWLSGRQWRRWPAYALGWSHP